MGQQKREREKINRPNTLPASRRTKGLSKSREELAGYRPAQPRQRQGGGERGRLGPKDHIPYYTANRPPVSNQRPREILGGRHPLGGSRLNTGRRHPTGAGGDWGWGRGGEKAHHARLALAETEAGTSEGRRCARQDPGCLSCSGLGRHKRRRSRLRAFVEHPRATTARIAGHPRITGHTPYRAAGSLSSVDGESSAGPSPQRDRTSNLKETTSARLCQGRN